VALRICWVLVSDFFGEVTQQIHSLRASGVISAQAASAFGAASSARLRSAGSRCTTPPAIDFRLMSSNPSCLRAYCAPILLKEDARVKQAKRLSDKQIYRYWVEVRELASGSVHKLPLTAVKMICLKTGKKNEPLPPPRKLLQLKDGEETWEVETFEELRTRLRDKYPDAAFERTLHYVRDHEAEERHERALSGLISLLAKAAVDYYIAEQSHAQAEPSAQPGPKRRRAKSRTQAT
jgi:hypothetical protein